MGIYSVLAGQCPYTAAGRYHPAGRKAPSAWFLHACIVRAALYSHPHGYLLMFICRKAFVALLLILTACAPPTPFDSVTKTPRPAGTASVPATETPAPATSSLKVEKERLRGAQINVWHPWFGAEASLFQSQ